MQTVEEIMEQTENEVSDKNGAVVEVGSFETIINNVLETEAQDSQLKLKKSVAVDENPDLATTCGLVIVEADSNTPFWSGISEKVDSIVKEYMQITKYRFVAYQKTASFLKDDISIDKHRVFFEDMKVKGGRSRPPQICYDGTPFIVVGKKIYDCEFGVDRSVAKKKMLLDIKALEALNKVSAPEENPKMIKRRKHPMSKKLACPCQIVIRDTVSFPTYKAKSKTEYIKKKAAKTLTNDLKERKDMPMKRKVFINLPSADEHQNHPEEGMRGRKRKRNRKRTKYDLEKDVRRTDSLGDHDYDDPSFTMVGGLSNSTCRIWSKYMLDLVKKLNNFNQPGLNRGLCRPLIIKGIKCGMIPLPVLTELQQYQEIFPFVKENSTGDIQYVTIGEHLQTAEERTLAVNNVLQQLREKNVFQILSGWRDELYAVSSSYRGELLFEMERAATGLFGIHTYGVHLNGFVKDGQNKMSMWIAKRSENKPTWPGKLDNMVGGGLTSGEKVQHILIKECLEEAMIPDDLARQAKPVGTVSYAFEDERGIFPETQFVYDLEIPISFEPMNLDGEVQSFHLLTIQEVKALISTDEFKPNCALIILDFLIRHGFIYPDEESNYTEFVKGTHC